MREGGRPFSHDSTFQICRGDLSGKRRSWRFVGEAEQVYEFYATEIFVRMSSVSTFFLVLQSLMIDRHEKYK